MTTHVSRGSAGPRALLLALTVAAFTGCDFSPTAPFEGFGAADQGIRLNGKFMSAGGQPQGLQVAQADFDGVTVQVKENPAITTDVQSDGSFTLRGLPEDEFTLVFLDAEGNVIDELSFDGVLANSEITIVIEMTSSGGITLVDEKRTGIGHGDVEIEGTVGEVNVTGDSAGNLVVNGYTVLVQPGVTAIREGNRSRSVDDLRSGSRVHIKGVWQDTSVLAQEIIIQEADDTDDDGDSGTTGNDCAKLHGAKVGQRIELEGTVDSVTLGVGFQLSVNGNRADGLIQVTFGGTPDCAGQAKKSGTCMIGAGDQVHVSGTLDSCTMVTATSVRIQKKGS